MHAHGACTTVSANRTAMAAAAPVSLCESFARDFTKRLIHLGKAAAFNLQKERVLIISEYWL